MNKLNVAQQGPIIELNTQRISHNNDHKIEHSQIAADSAGNVCKYREDAGWRKLTTYNASNGYKLVYIEGHQIPVHNVVWACFNGTIRKGCVIHHVDGNKTNNTLSNLQMVSRGTNVSYFFGNVTGENNASVGQTKYKYSLTDLIGAEFFVELPAYGLKISNKGTVKNIKTNHILTPTANVNYPSNLIVGYYKDDGKHSSISLSKLFAEAFMVTPDSKYMVLIKDNKDTLLSPLNYYIFSKKQKKVKIPPLISYHVNSIKESRKLLI